MIRKWFLISAGIAVMAATAGGGAVRVSEHLEEVRTVPGVCGSDGCAVDIALPQGATELSACVGESLYEGGILLQLTYDLPPEGGFYRVYRWVLTPGGERIAAEKITSVRLQLSGSFVNLTVARPRGVKTTYSPDGSSVNTVYALPCARRP